MSERKDFIFDPRDEHIILQYVGSGGYAFAYNEGLRRVSFGVCSGLTSIGEKAFIGCTALETVDLPVTLTEIGDGAFAGCKGLTVRAVAGSYAARYAEAGGIPVEYIED